MFPGFAPSPKNEKEHLGALIAMRVSFCILPDAAQYGTLGRDSGVTLIGRTHEK